MDADTDLEGDPIIIERRSLFTRLSTGLLPALSRIDRTITNVVSPMAITTLGGVCLYYTAISYGLVVVALIGGRHGLTRLASTSSTHPLIIIIAVPMIPVLLVCLEGIELEERSLSLWRNKVSPVLPKIPLFGSAITYFWPPLTREPFGSHRRESNSNMLTMFDYVARSLMGGLTLPFIGYLIGRGLFRNKGNLLQKTIAVSVTITYIWCYIIVKT